MKSLTELRDKLRQRMRKSHKFFLESEKAGHDLDAQFWSGKWSAYVSALELVGKLLEAQNESTDPESDS